MINLKFTWGICKQFKKYLSKILQFVNVFFITANIFLAAVFLKEKIRAEHLFGKYYYTVIF